MTTSKHTCKLQLELDSERAWLRRMMKILRRACRLAVKAMWAGGMNIIESNLDWENVTNVAKFKLERIQSMTMEASIISSRGKLVFTIERGRLWMGKPTRVLRS